MNSRKQSLTSFKVVANKLHHKWNFKLLFDSTFPTPKCILNQTKSSNHVTQRPIPKLSVYEFNLGLTNGKFCTIGLVKCIKANYYTCSFNIAVAYTFPFVDGGAKSKETPLCSAPNDSGRRHVCVSIYRVDCLYSCWYCGNNWHPPGTVTDS